MTNPLLAIDPTVFLSHLGPFLTVHGIRQLATCSKSFTAALLIPPENVDFTRFSCCDHRTFTRTIMPRGCSQQSRLGSNVLLKRYYGAMHAGMSIEDAIAKLKGDKDFKAMVTLLRKFKKCMPKIRHTAQRVRFT